MRSTRTLRLALLALLLGSSLPLLAGEPAPVSPATPEPAQTVTLDDLFAASQPESDEALFPAESWNCPFYTIICSTNSQCDAYCGGAGWGECIVYSGVMKCCACNT